MNKVSKFLSWGILTSTTFLLPTLAIAAQYDYRWTVQNTTSSEISGLVATSNGKWDTALLANRLWAAVPGRSERDTIQIRSFDNLASYVSTPDIPLSHFKSAGGPYNYWAAHLYFKDKEYFGLTTLCNITISDIEEMNGPQGGGHITIQFTENKATQMLSTMNILKPKSGQCTVQLYLIG